MSRSIFWLLNKKKTGFLLRLTTGHFLDFRDSCFASTQCKVHRPGEGWSLSPFCGASKCVKLESGNNADLWLVITWPVYWPLIGPQVAWPRRSPTVGPWWISRPRPAAASSRTAPTPRLTSPPAALSMTARRGPRYKILFWRIKK